MERKFVKIKLNDIDNLLKSINVENDNITYVIELENCNGITTKLLNSLESLPIDIKFKINHDLFYENKDKEKVNEDDFIDKIIYNYDISHMKKIISYFETVINAMPKMNDIGKFLFIYLCNSL